MIGSFTCIERGGVRPRDARRGHTRIRSRRRRRQRGDVGDDGGRAGCAQTGEIAEGDGVEDGERPEVGIKNGLGLWSTELGSGDHTTIRHGMEKC